MERVTYLIVGAGMTADAAVRGIRDVDKEGPIGVIGAEPDPPYARPPLSKALWKGEALDSIWRKTPEVGVTLHLGRRATALDPVRKEVHDDRGDVHAFDKLLLATGGSPRRFTFGGDDVIYFRSLEDYRRLRKVAGAGTRVAVIGGGFIGSEIAAALALQKCRVSMVFPDEGIGSSLFPADLAKHLVEYYREKGVDVRPRERVTDIRRSDGRISVETEGGARLDVDAVVAGIGIEPEITLAAEAGLTVEDGIVVDERLRTSDPAVFAAGAVARFHAPSLDRRLRVEHEDNAATMGRAAGRSMAGDETPYAHLPFFYSDLFDLGYEAVGTLDPRAETVADWKEPFREGVVYYLSRGKVDGILLWNTWGQLAPARALIAEPGPFRASDLNGRLPRE
jgi:NADPH-dependent 2,4-dienoyl-CoA reductase/sulfur reductase-like enzyme